ncbi:hypothetical protein MNBD_GAMMA12-873 [hydrothermal vent metagenome]|uniref:N-acetyltransferase domain-containing protein n=1 Tax=hydrothermal vent metagenome TaxID=652676 RepID=A0A3B0ZJG5_9ZZZZ
MNNIQYLNFDKIDLIELISILNENRIREHLIDHPVFDDSNIIDWVQSKVDCDSLAGSRIRAVVVDGKLGGWCGIQPEEDHFEIAIVLSESCWGVGPSIFRRILSWAEELGHKELYIHLLGTRPEYRFLAQRSKKIFRSIILGRDFTTYCIAVSSNTLK